MKKQYHSLLWVFIGLVAILTACQAAPDLNRPWHTATPEFAITAGQNTPVPAAVESVSAEATAVPVNSGTGAALEVAGAEDNPPFMYADANGNPAGLYPVLLDAIFKRMGITLTIKTYPWNRALAMGTNGEAPLAGIYKNDERLKIFDYSDAIYPNKILIYVKKGSAFNFETPADFAGKNLGIMSGWTYGDAFDKDKAAGKFTTEEVASDADNFKKLDLGRVDCILAESTIAEQIIRDQNYTGKVEALPTPVIVFDAYMVFAKSSNQTELLKTFNATLAEMKADGSYDKLIADWSGK